MEEEILDLLLLLSFSLSSEVLLVTEKTVMQTTENECQIAHPALPSCISAFQSIILELGIKLGQARRKMKEKLCEPVYTPCAHHPLDCCAVPSLLSQKQDVTAQLL
ncbi:uncharacterized protein VK521_002225 [Ammospiza maritima maritima]